MIATSPNPTLASDVPRLREVLDALTDAFGSPFHLYDIDTGRVLHLAPELPRCDQPWQLQLLEAAWRASQPQILAEEDAVVLFALPFSISCNLPWIAVAPFATRTVGEESLSAASRLLGLTPEAARAWINHQTPWPPHALERLGGEVLRRLKHQRRSVQLQHEVEKVSANLASSYEEISLLHSISQNFRLSRSDEELGSLAADWLLDCLPTRGIAAVYLPVAKPGDVTYKARTEPQYISSGDCPLSTADDALALVEALDADRHGRPMVVNHNRSEFASLLPKGLRQLIIAPMMEGDRAFGYLLAFNHVSDEEFGTIEANLLASVSSMLGIHCSNRDLYRQQDEFLASVVRALTSAIDAKDPYTCGHSDRVARVAARIAKQLGCDTDFLATIYMAGLLHDVGKIGIDDAVLRKAGRLTEAEFEHIKQHPGLGYKILADIKQFADVLPAVLHHHEQWDGQGYPCQLEGSHIPYMARIVAVADAYDAMTSDRPYRPGMPEEKVHAIFREGAGKQWDAEVIEAFFTVYEDIREIVQDQQACLSLDIETWLV